MTVDEEKHSRTLLKSYCFSTGKVWQFIPGCDLCGGGRPKAVIHTAERKVGDGGDNCTTFCPCSEDCDQADPVVFFLCFPLDDC